ncbi:MAG: hypothetical protein WC756_21175 [Taibaiella sp.]|jgi:hypothetical protein
MKKLIISMSIVLFCGISNATEIGEWQYDYYQQQELLNQQQMLRNQQTELMQQQQDEWYRQQQEQYERQQWQYQLNKLNSVRD